MIAVCFAVLLHEAQQHCDEQECCFVIYVKFVYVKENIKTMDNALKAITETCGEGVLVKGRYFKNFDADRLTGIKTLLRMDAKANGDLIHGDSFQFVASVPIEKQGTVLNDEYFLQRRAELDAAVPQYGATAPPSFAFRARQNNNDTCVTDVELGQYGGRVGVYKQMDDENGETTRYHLVACGGAQLACEDLQKFIGERVEAIENWSTPNTFDNNALRLSDEFGYAKHVAESNVRRMLYRAAQAFEVKIPTTQYVNVNLDLSKQSFPSMAIPQHMQTINTIDRELGPHHEMALGIYREAVPAAQIAQENPVYILEGPADPIHVFEVSGSVLREGLPATSGRRKQLPQNVGAIAIENAQEYKKKSEKVFFEGNNEHPDLDAGVFNKIQMRRDNREFVDSLISLGWNERNHHERLLPVCVKVSNPFLKRPATTATVSTAAATRVGAKTKMDDYDE